MQIHHLQKLFWSSCFLLSLAACQTRIPLVTVAEQPTLALPTLMPTALPLALTPITPTADVLLMEIEGETAVPTAAIPSSLPQTFTPMATSRPTGTSSPTPGPSPTPAPTLIPTETPLPVATIAIDRTCPDPIPLKPEYARYYLSGSQWPTPNPAQSAAHFWLSKPLPGGGRYLINQTFPYGWDGAGRLLLHNGVDSADPLGTPVLAAAAGTVVVAQADIDAWYGWRCDWYGHLVVIEHDQRWFGQPVYSLYGHVLNINVQVGQRVELGEQVAEVGFGGAATAPHLHFEVRIGSNEFGSTRNPMLWVYPGETRGVIAGRLLDPEGRPWQGVALSLLNEKGDVAATTWSYLDDPLHYINPDEGLAENFLFSDIPSGTYVVYTELQDVIYRQPVMVVAGEVVNVEIRTQPFKTPTPTPEE